MSASLVQMFDTAGTLIRLFFPLVTMQYFLVFDRSTLGNRMSKSFSLVFSDVKIIFIFLFLE